MFVVILRVIMMTVMLLFSGVASAAEPERWAVYYSDQLTAGDFEPFDLIVFDSESFPAFDTLHHKGKMVLGYISLGEAEEYRSYYKKLQERGLLIEKNAVWKDHTIIDVRNPAWTKLVVEELIPDLLHKGFQGIMVDTLDSPLYLEQRDPKQFEGMKQGVARMIKAIRINYPHLKIMINRGFDVLPDIAGDIDMVLAESTYSTYDFEKKEHKLVPESERSWFLETMKKLQDANPKLKTYTLDYWDHADSASVKRIYEEQRANGFVPYVSRVELQSVHREPK